MCSWEILSSVKPTTTATAISTGLQSIAVVWVKLMGFCFFKPGLLFFDPIFYAQRLGAV
jgi:hypothetical protein